MCVRVCVCACACVSARACVRVCGGEKERERERTIIIIIIIIPPLCARFSFFFLSYRKRRFLLLELPILSMIYGRETRASWTVSGIEYSMAWR